MHDLSHRIHSETVMAGYCLRLGPRAQPGSSVPVRGTLTRQLIDLDKLLGALAAELARSAYAAELDFDARLASRSKRILPAWLLQAMNFAADQTAEAAEALQPTSRVGICTLLLEAEVQLSKPLEIEGNEMKLVHLQIVPVGTVSKTGASSAMRIHMDGTAQGEVRLGALEAAIVAGKRAGQWKLWNSSAIEPEIATGTIENNAV
jgi:hypothetical protein